MDRGDFLEGLGQVSPDGKWLAYTSWEAGRPAVYVRSFPSGAGKWQVSTTNLGDYPRWRRDGRELYYMNGVSNGKLMAVEIKGNGSTFEPGATKELFDSGWFDISHTGNYHPYAVSADGQRFLVPRPTASVTGDPASLPIVVVLDWTAGLRK